MDCTLFEQVRDIIAKITRTPAENILPTTKLPDDPIKRIFIYTDVEDAFDIFVPLAAPEELITLGIVEKMETVSDVLSYMEPKIKEREEKARIAALKGRVGEFAQKLKNGEIEITDVPSEILLDVLPNVMDKLPVSDLSKVVKILKSDVSAKKQLLEHKVCELENRKQTLQKIKDDLKDT